MYIQTAHTYDLKKNSQTRHPRIYRNVIIVHMNTCLAHTAHAHIYSQITQIVNPHIIHTKTAHPQYEYIPSLSEELGK